MFRNQRVFQFFVMLFCAVTLGCDHTTSPDDFIRGTREVGGLLLSASLTGQSDDGFVVRVEFHNPGTVARTFKVRPCISAVLYSVQPAAGVGPAWGRTEDVICPSFGTVETVVAPGQSSYVTYGGSYNAYLLSRPRPGRYYPAVHVVLDIPDRVVILADLNSQVVVE